MASCVLALGFTFLMVGFLASGVSFCAPFWRVDQRGLFGALGSQDSGLWGYCNSASDVIATLDLAPDFACHWFHENDFQWEKNLPTWHKAAQALFAFGFVSVFAVLLVASVHLCCCCRDSRAIVRAVGAILFLGSLLMLASVGVYGGFSWKEHETSPESGVSRFNWGFYLGIGGSLVALLAGLMYLIESCRSTSHEGYQRGDVV